MFTDNIDTVISNGLETIEGEHLFHKGIGTVGWSSTDDEGQLNINQLNNMFYFTDS